MRMILAASAAAAVFAFAAAPASAQTMTPGTGTGFPWCAQYSDSSHNCGFVSFQQCQASVSGVGGQCELNPRHAWTGFRDRGAFAMAGPFHGDAYAGPYDPGVTYR